VDGEQIVKRVTASAGVATKVIAKSRWNAGGPPELSPEQRVARELAKRIKKLRWIGEEKKAKQLQAALSRLPPGESVLLLPMNTD
jgi:hypothetical protein